MQPRRSSQQAPSQSALAGNVMILCPGGLEHGGGIGRQMEYFLRAENAVTNARYRVVDTRGPWYLGASKLRAGLAVFYLVSAAVKLTAARLADTPAIVHVNITGRGSTIRKLILIPILRLIGLRYLLHVHEPDYGSDYRRRHRTVQALVRRAFQHADCVLVLGAAERQSLLHLLQLDSEKILVLPNAVPDPLPSARASRAGAKCHFLFLGYLSARKGVPELLQALAHSSLKGRPWRATLAGGGPVDEFRQMAAALGIGDRVEFPGWLEKPQVDGLCRQADVLVLPSHAEGLAMSVLEGLSYGLAVIATPVGAHTEVIEPNISGIFVPPGNAESLAAALHDIVENPARRQQLQDGARARFIEKFEISLYARNLANIHEKLLVSPGD